MKGRLEDNLNREYINRSRQYLWPSIVLLQSYIFLKPTINKIVAVGCGIGQTLGLTLIYQTSDFGKLYEVMEKVKETGEYITDMIAGMEYHALVLKPPVNLDAFIKGNYSKIYRPEQLTIYKGSKLGVLKRTKEAQQEFLKFMNTEFGGLNQETLNYLKDREYDLEPSLTAEILYANQS